jgi:hypothetical protein
MTFGDCVAIDSRRNRSRERNLIDRPLRQARLGQGATAGWLSHEKFLLDTR